MILVLVADPGDGPGGGGRLFIFGAQVPLYDQAHHLAEAISKREKTRTRPGWRKNTRVLVAVAQEEESVTRLDCESVASHSRSGKIKKPIAISSKRTPPRVKKKKKRERVGVPPTFAAVSPLLP